MNRSSDTAIVGGMVDIAKPLKGFGLGVFATAIRSRTVAWWRPSWPSHGSQSVRVPSNVKGDDMAFYGPAGRFGVMTALSSPTRTRQETPRCSQVEPRINHMFDNLVHERFEPERKQHSNGLLSIRISILVAALLEIPLFMVVLQVVDKLVAL